MIELKTNSKQVNINYPSYEGEDGGYYVPSVEGNILSWVASKAGMPAVEDSVLVIGGGGSGQDGKDGEDGYTPVKGVDYWTEEDKQEILEYVQEEIEVPAADLSNYYTKEEVNKKLDELEVPAPELDGYATEDYVDDAIANIELKQGEKGDKGDKGDTGEKGADGKDGADGYTPIKGVDYYTDAEKTSFVNEVLAALPAAEGVSV